VVESCCHQSVLLSFVSFCAYNRKLQKYVNFIMSVSPCETTGVLAERIFIKFDIGGGGNF
jgi:hypothetical protein